MVFRLSSVAGLAVCAAFLLTGCGGSSTGRNDLVFVSTRDGAYELYSMNADGSHQHRLTSDKGDNTSAAGLYYQLEPAWSPDGRLIAFASLRDGPTHIFVIDADGKHTRRLTSGSQADSHPTWSPDGKRIAFVRGAVRGATGPVVQVMNADGTDAHRVTSGSGSAGEPAWSPDGRWIAYDLKAPGATTSELWLVHPDGSDSRVLTSIGGNSISPAWSPDSKQIVFSSDNGGSTLSIYTVGVAGLGLRRLARPDADAITPAWSPDGKTLAFSADGAIALISASGTDEQTITNSKNNDSSPVWNPVQAVKAKGY